MYTKDEIMTVFTKPELKDGLKKYISIMEHLCETDVSIDKDFQKLYNHFYRMRQRTPKFYQVYYNYMEEMKKNADELSFEDVFFYIQKETGRCEASFSSKLLATLNPNKPVWDTFVLENLGVKKIYSTSSDREQKIVTAYNQICLWYEKFLECEEANRILVIFNQLYPGVKITDTKKIDLFLWQHREKK